MNERMLNVQTADGRMDLFVAHPDGNGPFPVVVMYHNVGGMSPVMLELARLVAANGYCCAMPDLYYRLGKVVIDPDSKDPHVLTIRKTLLDSLSDARVMDDTKAVVDFLRSEPIARKGQMGTVGFCMGGRFAVQAGGIFPDIFTANGSLFGTRMITDAEDSPHKLLDRLRGEIYFGFAECDTNFTVDKAREFIGLLKEKCSAKFDAEIHAGAHHGYTFPGRAVYHKEATERSWEKIFAMYKRQLKPNPA